MHVWKCSVDIMAQISATLVLLLLTYPFCETKFDDLRKNLALETFSANHNKSMVVSTLLLRFSLCKLATIAINNSKTELMRVLGIKSDKELLNCYKNFDEALGASRDIDLVMLNKIVLNYTTEVRPSFIANSSQYGVKVDQVGFNYPKMAALFTNRWFERASIKRLSDVLEPKDIDNKTSIIVVNAAYLKVTWEFPFDMRLTKNMKFRHHDGNVSMVPMMKKTESYLYLNDDATNAHYVNMKLASFGFSITIAVPSTPNGITRLLYALSSDPNSLKGIYGRMRYERINVMLPRFKVKTAIDWNTYLQKIGLMRLFNDTNSDLNGILTEKPQPTKNMYLSKVKQTCVVDVDEMGIFRQAINEDIFNNPYPRMENTVRGIIADHPFLFALNLQTDASNRFDIYELFTGIYYGPNY